VAINIKNAAWFMKYQPKTIDDLVFDNEDHRSLVTKWLNNNRIDGNVIFYGKAGLGKTATSELLITNIIKVQNDLFKSSDRSVKMIDEQLRPFLTKKPIKSPQKIVYLEEIDKMSPQAQVALKEGLLEKYQNYVSFICCTNYNKKVDSALMTRFTYKIPFSGTNVEGVINRLKTILDNENAQYEEENLIKFVNKFYKSGIRELINTLQKEYISNNGIIKFSNTIGQNDNLEEKVFKLMMEIIAIIGNAGPKDRLMCLKQQHTSIISKQYSELTNIVQSNMDINYDYVFDRIVENTMFYLPLNYIVVRYSEQAEQKKYMHCHLLACLYDMMKCLVELNG
jgi:DNA polymerase III delta prime subunit